MKIPSLVRESNPNRFCFRTNHFRIRWKKRGASDKHFPHQKKLVMASASSDPRLGSEKAKVRVCGPSNSFGQGSCRKPRLTGKPHDKKPQISKHAGSQHSRKARQTDSDRREMHLRCRETGLELIRKCWKHCADKKKSAHRSHR